MDSVDRKVKAIIGNAAARAYGFRRTDDQDPATCPRCHGDGCLWCGWTGEIVTPKDAA